MEAVVLVIHLILALAIIGLVLLQRSEGGGLGIGGGNLGNLATARGMGNALTRATAICAAAFFCTSLILGVMAGRQGAARQSIYDTLEQPTAEAPAALPEETTSPTTQDAPDSGGPPAVPIAK